MGETRSIARVNRARNFPFNTCGASRHAQMIGEALAGGKPYPMLQEEPEHCGTSILSTVASLFEARSLLLQHGIDPWSGLPLGSKELEKWEKMQTRNATRRIRRRALEDQGERDG